MIKSAGISLCILLFIACFASGNTLAPADTFKTKTQTTRLQVSDSATRYIQIYRIFIIGNKRTRDNIILRELTLKPGDVIEESALNEILEKDSRKLFNLHLFNYATIRPLEVEYGKSDLIVEVDERWYTWPIPVFQLSDRNFNEWWENYNHDLDRVTYGLKLYQYNMRGRNESLILTAFFGFQKRFELLYRIPYLDKKQKQGLILNMHFSEAKNIPYQTVDHKLEFIRARERMRQTRGISLAYTYRNSFYNHHRLKLEYQEATIADTIQFINPNYFDTEQLRQTYDAISYEFTSDHRDVFAYPLNGYYLQGHLQHSGITLQDDFTKTEAWLSFAKYVDLKNNFFLSNFTFAYASTPDELPYYNFGVMGYNKIFVRGYEIYVVEGPQFILNKTTFKKRIFNRVYNLERWPMTQFRHIPFSIFVKAYADWGYVRNYPNYEINSRLSNTHLGGAGLGIDLVSSYDIVLRFEYTFTLENTNGFFFHIKKEF